MSDPSFPASPKEGRSPPTRFRKLCRGAAWVAGVLIVLFYNVDLIPMARHTMIPFVALFVVGLLLGLALPDRAAVASLWAWGAVVAAVAVRRFQMLGVPLATQIFGGVLAVIGYPAWAVWLAEFLRLGVYGAALKLGASQGAKLRGGAPRGAP